MLAELIAILFQIVHTIGTDICSLDWQLDEDIKYLVCGSPHKWLVAYNFCTSVGATLPIILSEPVSICYVLMIMYCKL